jgi:glycosyltransferase involved in cell wall biosynthesis
MVAVRNTDINVFMKLRPDLRWICWETLRNAARVIFITPSYRETLVGRVPAKLGQMIDAKSELIPNGLEPFWLEPPAPIKSVTGGLLRLLYVGDFSRNKNIIGAMQAARLLNNQSPTSLTLVGAGGDGEDQIDHLLATGDWPFVERVGRVDKRDALRAIYRSHDIFIMPSFFETFGMSYIEALSQGLPVVHSKGQGIDGYFAAGTVAEAVDPTRPAAIAAGVSALADRLSEVKALCIAASTDFAWRTIAERYYRIYRDNDRENYLSSSVFQHSLNAWRH